ncbi:MAG: hypothetical protein M1821_006749 [Bathelium mastoideum]|nr:MAG: hypothetical protein M1821_006749 [Bathelium mastoideum]
MVQREFEAKWKRQIEELIREEPKAREDAEQKLTERDQALAALPQLLREANTARINVNKITIQQIIDDRDCMAISAKLGSSFLDSLKRKEPKYLLSSQEKEGRQEVRTEGLDLGEELKGSEELGAEYETRVRKLRKVQRQIEKIVKEIAKETDVFDELLGLGESPSEESGEGEEGHYVARGSYDLGG